MGEELEGQSAHTQGSGQSVNIIMPNARWQNAVIAAALAVALCSFVVSWQAEREARLSEYYAVDVELCLLKKVCNNPNGVPVPADPWGHSKGNPK